MAWAVSPGIDPTFFFLFQTWTYSLSDFKHHELSEHEEEGPVAGPVADGGAKTKVTLGGSQVLGLEGCKMLRGVPWAVRAAHLLVRSCKATSAGLKNRPLSFPLTEGPVSTWGRPFCQRDEKFACLVIAVLGVAFWHFSETQPYIV